VQVQRYLGLVLAFWAVVAHADDAKLRYGDSKGVMKALLTAAGELTDIRYRVEWAEFPATAPALEALSAGAIDLRLSAGAPLIFALAAGAPLKSVALLRTDSPGASVAILVLPASPIHSAADLPGQRIATNKGSVGHHLVLAAFQRDRIPLADINIQYLLPSDAKAALEGGSVDAWSTWDPYVSLALIQDHLRPVIDGSQVFPNSISGDLVASTQAIITKRDLLGDFIRRITRAEEWRRQHPEEYVRLLAQQTGLPIAASRLVAEHLSGHYVAVDDAAVRDHQDVADLYVKAGVIRHAVNVTAAFDRSLFPVGKIR
jgi:sulfonate transport system substrate-binding protein